MKRTIFVPEGMTKGYTRRQFLELLQLGGACLVIGSTGLLAGCQKSSGVLAGSNEVITRCGLCGAECGMKAYLKNDRVVAVAPWKEDPYSKGFLCDMGFANVEQTYAPDRILNPRKREGDKWIDISWDEALGIMSTKLTELKNVYGPESLVCHYGLSQVRMSFYRDFIKRFANVYGTPNFTGCGSQCAVSTGMAQRYSIGSAWEDYENTKCMIQWGCNPSASRLMVWLNKVLPAKERGAKLICIDPRANAMTRMADIHLRPRPGTDGALALAMMNMIVSSNLYNRDLVEKQAVGFTEFKDVVAKYTPKRAATITGIPVKDIENTVKVYLDNAPACINTGNALELHENGVQTIRSIMLLQVLSGNFNVKGGIISSDGEKVKLNDMELNDLATFKAKGFTADRYPLLWQVRKMVTANLLPETLLTGKPYPVKALIVVGGNPVVTGPNASHQREAYKKLDLMVVHDLFMTETAKSSNLFLPATSCLERDSLKMRDRIYLTPKVIAERGNAWPEWKFWSELGKKMGYEKEFPWKTVDEAIDYHLAPIKVTAADLRKNFDGLEYPEKSGNKNTGETKIKTASGKIEFHSQTLADAGYNPIPDYVEPRDNPEYKKLQSRFPLLMTSGARIPYFVHSSFRNLPLLKAKDPGPIVEMNPDDAASLGISEGSSVAVTSPRGSIRAKARLVDGLNSGIVAMSDGSPESNVNELTDDALRDPISGFPAYRGFLCKVEKV